MRPAGDVLVVLAGGRSQRFGSDKAIARFGVDAEPMLQRALRRLEEVAPRQVVVRATPIVGLDPRVLRVVDPRPGDGPLQALGAAFAATRAPRGFCTAPCDLPWLEPEAYARPAAALGGHEVAVARAPDGLEPLVSIWSEAAAARLGSWLARAPQLAVHAALDRLDRAEVEFDDPRPFQNVNTPEELARAAALDAAAPRPASLAGGAR